MSIVEKELEQIKEIAQIKITPFLFDLFCTFRDIKQIETVCNIYVNSNNDKFEIYIFYEKENFDIEDKIVKHITNWEEEYRYFPEVFIYPVDMIENKTSVLPDGVMEI